MVVASFASLGGASVIILGVSSWIGKIWAEKIAISLNAQNQRELEQIKSDYMKELEYLRAEISERKDALSSTMGIFSTGVAKVHSEVLDGIKVVWSNAIKFSNSARRHITASTTLSSNQIEVLSRNKNSKILPPSNTELTELYAEMKDSAEQYRPFVGERIWRIFSVYTAVLILLAKKIRTENANGKILHWTKDEKGNDDANLFAMLRLVLDKTELSPILQIADSNYESVITIIESKMLSEMYTLIFGKQLVDISIGEQLRIAKLLQPDATIA